MTTATRTLLRLLAPVLAAILAPMLSCLMSAPSLGADEPPRLEDWSIESRSEVFDADGIVVLQVDQPVGNVHIKGVDVDSVTFTMAVQRHQDDPRRAVLRPATEPGDRVDGSDRLALIVEFAQPEDSVLEGMEPENRTAGSGRESEPESWTRRRIDIGIQTPRGLDLVVRTGDGRVDVEGVEGSVEISTVTGDVLAEIESGAFRVHSRRGSIRAKVMTTRTDEPVALESVNGSLWVQLLEGASARLRLESSNLISTDYSVEIEREPGQRRKVAHATVGDGRRPIELSTVNGEARISNVIVEEADAAGQ